MKISVKIKPRSRENSIEKIDDFHFLIRVKEPPVLQRANQAMIKILSEYLGLPKSKIRIVSGHKSKNKTVEIE